MKVRKCDIIPFVCICPCIHITCVSVPYFYCIIIDKFNIASEFMLLKHCNFIVK